VHWHSQTAFSVSLRWYAGTCRDPIAHCEQKVAVGEFVQRIKTPCGEERIDFRLKDSIVVGNSRSARERWFGAATVFRQPVAHAADRTDWIGCVDLDVLAGKESLKNMLEIVHDRS